MRILHVTDCYLPRLGGIELQVHDLARRQSASHDVTVLTTTPGPVTRAEPTAAGSFRVVRACPPEDATDDIRYFSSPGGLRFLRAADHDLVHVHASSFSPLAFLAAHHASLAGVPTAATVHSLWGKASPLFAAADVLTGWGDWPVAWSAVSGAAAAPLRRIVGGRAPVTILANGVDPDEWRTPAAAGPEDLRIAVVCRLAPRKRPRPLLDLLAEARRRIPGRIGIRVEIAGDGPERIRIERDLDRHGMRSWVHLRGRLSRPEIRSLYARSNLFIAPAHLESFGIAALEARCAGLPVLALARTGVADFVEHGREGWLVRSDKALLETVVSLATSPAMLERVAAHNRTVPPAVSWPGVLDACADLYRRAAAIQGVEHGVAGTAPLLVPATPALSER